MPLPCRVWLRGSCFNSHTCSSPLRRRASPPTLILKKSMSFQSIFISFFDVKSSSLIPPPSPPLAYCLDTVQYMFLLRLTASDILFCIGGLIYGNQWVDLKFSLYHDTKTSFLSISRSSYVDMSDEASTISICVPHFL